MKILVVDDETMQREMLKGFLEKQGYGVFGAGSGREALQLFSEHPITLVLLDHRMPDLNGDEVLARMKAINPLVRAVMITAYGSVDTAVAVMKLGADDFIEKPVDLSQLLEKIQLFEQHQAVDDDAAQVNRTLEAKSLPMKIVGESRGMRTVFSLVRRIAPTPWTVLIRGETGTGKELIARLIHLLSPAANGPFVDVNCGAIPENLFESELFGHEKGSFTGALSRRRGRFELAESGTLFLDEVGELPMGLQSKLLRALQEKKICRVGAESDIGINARVIAATNRDLKQRVAEGLFRDDLYYRLKVLDLEIPPLRERKKDIPALVDFFLERYSVRPVRFDEDAMAVLLKYAFPGNVRELEHVIQRTATLVRGSVAGSSDLPAEMRFQQAIGTGTLAQRLESMEREMLQNALERAEWVQTRAAEALGISERVLRYKLAKYKLKRM
jgi:two-component system, NtrC family, response regulator AtoC